MKVITPGHKYELANFESTKKPGQTLQFIQKENKDGKFVTVADGTTNEEVIEVLINRIAFLNAKAPHFENKVAGIHLFEALAALNRRTSERKARGVEGTPAK